MAFYDGRMLGDPTVTRRLINTQYGPVDLQEVTIDVENTDESLTGDLRGVPFTLDLYDPNTGAAIVQGIFVVSDFTRSRGRATIIGANFDLTVLEALVPVGTITSEDYPLVQTDNGKTAPWVFGNVVNMPLLYVRDGVEDDTFDYLLGRGTLASIRALRRLARDPAATDSFDVISDELEPYPGMGGVLLNGNLEGWDAGATSAPDGYTLNGAGATVAKNITVGQFDEGSASASLTRVGTDCFLDQRIDNNSTATPIAWWQVREITVTARVRATVAGTVFIQVRDGVVNTTSPAHSGSGLFETLSVDCVINVAATIVRIRLLVNTTNQTAQFDDVRVYLRARNLNECLRTDLYPGFSAIRIFTRQTDETGALYQLVGDLNGLQPERNPVRAIRTLLSDPTHGLGKTVNAASFDAGEIAIAMSYQDLVLPDAPALLLDFDEASEATVALDGSGHERHGAYHPESAYPSSNADFHVGGVLGGRGVRDGAIAVYAIDAAVDDSYVDVPYYNGAYSPTVAGWTFEMFYTPLSDVGGGVMDTSASAYSVLDFLVGTATGTGPLRIYQRNGALTASTNSSGGGASITLALTNADLTAPLHLVVTFSALTTGTMTFAITRLDGSATRTGSAAFAGAITTGDGKLLVGKFGTGWPGGAPGKGYGKFDKVAVYLTALSAARLTARRDWLVTVINGGGPQISPTGAGNSSFTMTDLPSGFHAPTYFYTLDDIATTTMVDQGSAVHNGIYEGAPTLNAPGYLPNQYTGHPNQGVSFENNIAKYAHVDTVTISGAKLALSVWYKPDAQKAPSGVLEFAIGGVRDTSVSLCQTASGTMRFRIKDATATFKDVIVPVLPEDVGRYMHLRLGYDSGVQTMKKNNVTLATGTYTSPVTVASSTLYVGCQGTNGGPLTRPCQGDIDDLAIYDNYALTDADGDCIYTAGTWQFGGLCVDAALLEQRQAQTWLRQFLLLWGMRLGVSATGQWTVSVDTPAAAPTVTLRDGLGDGVAPNLLDLRDRKRSPLKNAIRDYVLKFRKDLFTGIYLCEQRYAVSTLLDAAGNRIGLDWEEESEVLRTLPAAGRAVSYLGQYAIADETVVALVEPVDGTPLFEGMLVMVIDPALNYSGDTLIVRAVQKQSRGSELTLAEDPSAAFTWTPTAFPISPGPEA